MNPRTLVAAIVAVAALTMAPAGGYAGGEARQPPTQLEREVTEALHDERDLRRLEVSIVGSEATLSGRVPHLFAKNLAIELALEVDGIETVSSGIEMPEPESDEDISEQVVRAVSRYSHYTIWDSINGRVNQGVVTLFGSVTPDRDKKGDLYKDITKIKGVQEYVDNIEIQSPSSEDERLRRVILRTLSVSDNFERLVGMRNPPFRIVVDRGMVTLVGYAQSEIDYREMERIVAQTQGVLRVNNQLVVP